MRLNKNGWGYAEFFAFLAIFIICLMISAVGLKHFGLLDENWHFIDITNKDNINNEENNSKPKVTYSSLREDMVSATMKYISKYYNNDLGLDTLNIRVSQLMNEGYIEVFKDADGNKCSGYVSVYLDEEKRIQYVPYLKCKNYETSGYEARKDD